jgi:hypothetical protein
MFIRTALTGHIISECSVAMYEDRILSDGPKLVDQVATCGDTRESVLHVYVYIKQHICCYSLLSTNNFSPLKR